MFAFTKGTTAMNSMEDSVEFLGFVRKSAIVIEDVWMLLATGAFLRKLAFPLPLAATWSQFGDPFFAIRNIWSVIQIFLIFLRDTLTKYLFEYLSPFSLLGLAFR